MNHLFQVGGMTCGHCARAVTRAVQDLDADAQVVIDLGTGGVAVDSKLAAESLAAAIRAEGYAVERRP